MSWPWRRGRNPEAGEGETSKGEAGDRATRLPPSGSTPEAETKLAPASRAGGHSRRSDRALILAEGAIVTASVLRDAGRGQILRVDREVLAPGGDDPSGWEERAAAALAALRDRGSLKPGGAEVGLALDSVAYRTYHFPPAGRSDRDSLIERSLRQEPAFQDDEIFWDTHSLGVAESDGVRREAHLVAVARRDVLDGALRVLRRARIIPKAFLTPELAVFSWFLASAAGAKAREPVLLLHARGRRLTFGVCREGKPLFYRSLEVDDGTEGFGGENSFLLECRRSLLFYQDQHHGGAISQVVVLGDPARFPADLEATLDEQFGLQARFLPDPSLDADRAPGGPVAEGIDGAELRELASLALLPRGSKGLSISLLPHERREWRRKTVLAGAMTASIVAATAVGAFAVSEFDRSLENRRQAVDTMAIDPGRAEEVHDAYAALQARLQALEFKEAVREELSSGRMDFSGTLAAVANRIPQGLAVELMRLRAGGRPDDPSQNPEGVLEGVVRRGGDRAANPLDGLMDALGDYPAVADLHLDLGAEAGGALLGSAGDPFRLSFRWRRP